MHELFLHAVLNNKHSLTYKTHIPFLPVDGLELIIGGSFHGIKTMSMFVVVEGPVRFNLDDATLTCNVSLDRLYDSEANLEYLTANGWDQSDDIEP